MISSQLLVTSILAGSLVSALPCNGCRGCLLRLLESDITGITGIHARWWYGNTVPEPEDVLISRRGLFEIPAEINGGQYLEKPDTAIGIILLSGKEDAAVAGWLDSTHDGPWQIYGEQTSNSSKFHYLGDSKTVFVGLI